MAFWDGWEEEGGSWGNLDTILMVVDDRIGIGIATKKMHDGSFSQLPVCSGQHPDGTADLRDSGSLPSLPMGRGSWRRDPSRRS